MENAQVLVNENRNNPQPEGRQAKWDDRQTDYEEAGGLAEIQWQPGIFPGSVRLDK